MSDVSDVVIARVLITAVAVVIFGVIAGITICDLQGSRERMHKNELGTAAVQALVEKGHNPLEVHCAVWNCDDALKEKMVWAPWKTEEKE